MYDESPFSSSGIDPAFAQNQELVEHLKRLNKTIEGTNPIEHDGSFRTVATRLSAQLEALNRPHEGLRWDIQQLNHNLETLLMYMEKAMEEANKDAKS